MHTILGANGCELSRALLEHTTAVRQVSRSPRRHTASRWRLRIMGLFTPALRENMEMMYQYEHNYIFDSSRTQTQFDLTPPPYREGIPATLHATGG